MLTAWGIHRRTSKCGNSECYHIWYQRYSFDTSSKKHSHIFTYLFSIWPPNDQACQPSLLVFACSHYPFLTVMWFKIWAQISHVRMSQVKPVFLMNSELATEWQQVSPEVQIEWKIKGDRDTYLFFVVVVLLTCHIFLRGFQYFCQS